MFHEDKKSIPGSAKKTTDPPLVKPRPRFTPHLILKADWRVRRMGVARSVVYFAATNAMSYLANVMVGGHGGALQSDNIYIGRLFISQTPDSGIACSLECKTSTMESSGRPAAPSINRSARRPVGRLACRSSFSINRPAPRSACMSACGRVGWYVGRSAGRSACRSVVRRLVGGRVTRPVG